MIISPANQACFACLLSQPSFLCQEFTAWRHLQVVVLLLVDVDMQKHFPFCVCVCDTLPY
jgi:hypothetical protein